VQLTVVDDQVHLRIPIAANGFQGAVTATGTLAVADGKVRVKLTNVASEGGNIPPVIARFVNSAAQNLTLNIKIPAMPYKLTIKKVETTKTGIVATAAADHVRLAG
jgi:hypothetical protein